MSAGEVEQAHGRVEALQRKLAAVMDDQQASSVRLYDQARLIAVETQQVVERLQQLQALRSTLTSDEQRDAAAQRALEARVASLQHTARFVAQLHAALELVQEHDALVEGAHAGTLNDKLAEMERACDDVHAACSAQDDGETESESAAASERQQALCDALQREVLMRKAAFVERISHEFLACFGGQRARLEVIRRAGTDFAALARCMDAAGVLSRTAHRLAALLQRSVLVDALACRAPAAAVTNGDTSTLTLDVAYFASRGSAPSAAQGAGAGAGASGTGAGAGAPPSGPRLGVRPLARGAAPAADAKSKAAPPPSKGAASGAAPAQGAAATTASATAIPADFDEAIAQVLDVFRFVRRVLGDEAYAAVSSHWPESLSKAVVEALLPLLDLWLESCEGDEALDSVRTREAELVSLGIRCDGALVRKSITMAEHVQSKRVASFVRAVLSLVRQGSTALVRVPRDEDEFFYSGPSSGSTPGRMSHSGLFHLPPMQVMALGTEFVALMEELANEHGVEASPTLRAGVDVFRSALEERFGLDKVASDPTALQIAAAVRNTAHFVSFRLITLVPYEESDERVPGDLLTDAALPIRTQFNDAFEARVRALRVEATAALRSVNMARFHGSGGAEAVEAAIGAVQRALSAWQDVLPEQLLRDAIGALVEGVCECAVAGLAALTPPLAADTCRALVDGLRPLLFAEQQALVEQSLLAQPSRRRLADAIALMRQPSKSAQLVELLRAAPA